MKSSKQVDAIKSFDEDSPDVTNHPQVRNGTSVRKYDPLPAGQERTTFCAGSVISNQQNSSSLPPRKDGVQDTAVLKQEDLKDGHLFHDTSSTTENTRNGRQDQIPKHRSHHSVEGDDNDSADVFNKCGLCSMALDDDHEAEPIQYPVDETRFVKVDPSIKLLRQRIQEEQKLESSLDIGQLEVIVAARQEDDGRKVVSHPNNLTFAQNGKLLDLARETDDHHPCTRSPSSHVANSNDRLASSDTTADVSRDKSTCSQQTVEPVSSINKDDPLVQYYKDYDDGNWSSIFLMCDDSISDWANYNSLQYQFI